jgi:hypothetical protein
MKLSPNSITSTDSIKSITAALRARGVKSPSRIAPLAKAAAAKKEAAKKVAKPARIVKSIADNNLYHAARNAARDKNKRIQNWESAEPTVRRASLGEYRTTDHGQYSSRCKYTHYTYTPLYHSAITLGLNGCAVLHTYGFSGAIKSRAIKAPKGCKFSVDQNGLLVRRISDSMDFHPTVADLKASDFATRIREGLAANFVARREVAKLAKNQQREAKIFAREIKSTRVTLSDSRLAGNCVEGTLAFAERKLGIDRADILAAGYLFSVPATKLLSVVNGDKSRVEAAVKIAWARETTVSI